MCVKEKWKMEYVEKSLTDEQNAWVWVWVFCRLVLFVCERIITIIRQTKWKKQQPQLNLTILIRNN